jgi:multimeric flavodoxin WrbA
VATLLVVFHSRSGGAQALCDSLIEGARYDGIEGVDIVVRSALDATADDVVTCDGIAIVTPEHFGSMAGLIKDFFERVYFAVLETTRGLPYVIAVKAGNDGSGTVASVEKLATGLHWRRVLEPVIARGGVDETDRAACSELGATFAAGLAEGLF